MVDLPIIGKIYQTDTDTDTHNYRTSLKMRWMYRHLRTSKVTNFSTLASALTWKGHIAAFQAILSNRETAVLIQSSTHNTDTELARYNLDWTKKYIGKSRIVLKPASTEEVSRLLRYCNENSIGVVPQGGNTSLVGGAIALYEDDVVISMEKMNRIIYHDSTGNILTCEAGCILHDLEEYLHQQTNCTVPYDLAAKGTCQIGGNIATNAGGLRLVRYGNLHGLVLGLEVVLPNGEILVQNMVAVPENNSQSELHTSLRKDNTGYDLKQLFIGSEGTLGIITKVSIHTPMRSSSTNVTSLTLHPQASMEDIAQIFVRAKQKLNEILSAFEFWDDLSVQLVNFYRQKDGKRFLSVDQDSPNKPIQKYILIETMGSNSIHDQEKIMQFLEEEMEMVLSNSTSTPPVKVIQEGFLAKDQTEVQQFWSQRELITVSAAAYPETIVVLKYDLSLPQLYMYEPILQTRQRLQQWWETLPETSEYKQLFLLPLAIGFGHFGDGNIHLNVLLRKRVDFPKDEKKLKIQEQWKQKYMDEVIGVMEPWIYDQIVQQWKGSISAEHGIGIQKTSYLPSIKSPIEYQLMKSIKKVFDPKGIMNRGKIISYPNE